MEIKTETIVHQIGLVQKSFGCEIVFTQNILNTRMHAVKFSGLCCFTKISIIFKHDQHYR